MLENHIYPKKVHSMITGNNKSNNAHLFIEVISAKNSNRTLHTKDYVQVS